MPRFRMFPLNASSVLEIYRQRDLLNLDPPYQRLSVWDRTMQERFIDSIINGFDVPKLYFHELRPSSTESLRGTRRRARYSVIDGKQRLLALWAFIEGDIGLPDDFVFFDDTSLEASGARYLDLLRRFPTLRARFDSYDLPITIVDANDADFIEGLFWRLNIQKPLSAAERRNAFGAPLPYRIRRVAVSTFFQETASLLANGRLQHYDMAAKFLFITRANQFVSTKRETLDSFVKDFRKLRNDKDDAASDEAMQALEDTTQAVLDEMNRFFDIADPLLLRFGRTTLYFHVFRIHRKLGEDIKFTRSALVQFDEEVASARGKADRRARGFDESMSPRDVYLREFDRHKQSPNDAGALRQQYGYLRTYLLEEFGVEIPEAD